MKKLGAWIKASRLTSQSYIALPLLLGQVLAWRVTGSWDWRLFALVHAFGLFDQLYIVYANDWADVETDRDNETPTLFSGGSRVLVDGGLDRSELGYGAIAMAVICMILGAVMTFAFGQTLALPLIVFGLFLLWAYSFPPIELSYRGGGELLQMLGVGAVLPAIGFVAQGGSLDGFPWVVLAVTSPLSLATAMCTALPDEPSDRRASKHTSAVIFGPALARGVVLLLNIVGMLALYLAMPHTLAGVSLPLTALLAIPILSQSLAFVFYKGAEAGSKRIIGFVIAGAAVNLATVAGLIVVLSPEL